MNMDHKFKLRAEAWMDLVSLADALFPHGRPPRKFSSLSIVVTYDASDLPEFVMELTSTLTLEELLDVIWQLEDGHVMYETVQPIERYTGERVRDRDPPWAEAQDGLDDVMAEMAVALAEVNLASAQMRLMNRADTTEYRRAEVALDGALRRLGELDARREALQDEDRKRRRKDQ